MIPFVVSVHTQGHTNIQNAFVSLSDCNRQIPKTPACLRRRSIQTQTQMLTVYFMPQLHLKLGEGFFIRAKNVAEEVKNQFQFSDILDR